MLRRANEMADRERRRAAEDLDKDDFVRKTRAEAEKEAMDRCADDLKLSTREHEALKREVQEFEEASGIKINMWNGRRMGEAVKLLMNLNDVREIKEIGNLAEEIYEKAKRLKEDANQLKEVGTSFLAGGKISP